ncbi:MAG: hypothetical protein AAF723_05335, partial [Pseudomonadota bacterium]
LGKRRKALIAPNLAPQCTPKENTVDPMLNRTPFRLLHHSRYNHGEDKFCRIFSSVFDLNLRELVKLFLNGRKLLADENS